MSFAIADFTLVSEGTHYEASKEVPLTITNDPVDEEDETFSLQLTVSGSPANEVTVAADTTVTITDDDDVPGIPTLTAQGGYEAATLQWTAPVEVGTSTIEAYDYRVSTDTTAPYTWDPDWTAIPDSGAGGANETSYTVATHAGAALLNGTTYTFEVRARSAAGGGEGAQATAAPNEVCGRSQQIREAIIAATPATACADVTPAHLATITALDLRGRTIRELTNRDFAGLSRMVDLKMSRVRLTTLPDGIFAGLTALTDIVVGFGQRSRNAARRGIRRPHRADDPRTLRKRVNRPASRSIRQFDRAANTRLVRQQPDSTRRHRVRQHHRTGSIGNRQERV